MAEKGYVSQRGLRSTKTRLLRSAFAIVTFTVALGGALYRDLIGWPGYLVVLCGVLVWGVVLFAIDKPDRFRWYRLPAPVFLYLIVVALALFWAANLGEAATKFAIQLAATVLAVMIAYLLTWQETLRTLASSLRFLLAINLILSIWQPRAFALIAVMGVIVFGVQAFAGLQRPTFGAFWIFVSFVGVFVSQSAVAPVAVQLGALSVALITLVFALWARKSPADSRMPMYWFGLLALAVTIFAVLFWRDTLLPAVGIDARAAELENVWVSVFKTQGWLGLVFFVLLVFVTTWRVWFRAVDQPRRGAGAPLDYATSALWPLLVTLSLLVFSLVQGTLTSETGWFLLVLFAIKTRFDYVVPAKHDDTRKMAWRDVPLPV